ncbi:MAG: hypothetical protein AAFY78_22515 [Cyanobacteria bacterium J06648_16]
MSLVVQSIKGNLPPTIETVPVEMQDELLALQTASVENLRQIAKSEVPEAQQQRHLALLAQNQTGQLSSDEQQELSHLVLLADQPQCYLSVVTVRRVRRQGQKLCPCPPQN